MEQKTDLRVIKTRRALAESMLSCLEEKRFEDITVQSICDRALVRRATFYTHFTDKYDLFAYATRVVYQQFPSYRHLSDETLDQREICLRLIEDAVNFMTSHTKVLQSLMNSELTFLMFNIIATEIQKDLTQLLAEEIQIHTDFDPELVINFHIRGILGTCMWWLSTNQTISKEELIRQLRGLLLV